MYFHVRMLDRLELELQTDVSSHVGPLEEQPVLLSAEPSPQPLTVNFLIWILRC